MIFLGAMELFRVFIFTEYAGEVALVWSLFFQHVVEDQVSLSAGGETYHITEGAFMTLDWQQS
jgi:hypothetical protein